MRERSTSTSGEPARAFITLTSVWPPASARAPSFAARSSIASPRDAGRAYPTSRRSIVRGLYKIFDPADASACRRPEPRCLAPQVPGTMQRALNPGAWHPQVPGTMQRPKPRCLAPQVPGTMQRAQAPVPGTAGARHLPCALRQQPAVTLERSEDAVDVLERVVGVRRDAEVPVPLRGDDPVRGERGHEPRRVGRADADERPVRVRRARRGDPATELVDARDQVLVQRGHVLTRLGDADLLHQLDARDARVDVRDR